MKRSVMGVEEIACLCISAFSIIVLFISTYLLKKWELEDELNKKDENDKQKEENKNE